MNAAPGNEPEKLREDLAILKAELEVDNLLLEEFVKMMEEPKHAPVRTHLNNNINQQVAKIATKRVQINQLENSLNELVLKSSAQKHTNVEEASEMGEQVDDAADTRGGMPARTDEKFKEFSEEFARVAYSIEKMYGWTRAQSLELAKELYTCLVIKADIDFLCGSEAYPLPNHLNKLWRVCALQTEMFDRFREEVCGGYSFPYIQPATSSQEKNEQAALIKQFSLLRQNVDPGVNTWCWTDENQNVLIEKTFNVVIATLTG